MDYWSSAEADTSIVQKFIKVSKAVDPDIASVFGRVNAKKGGMFVYIPILMGEEFIEFYPQRSSYDSVENKVFHSPQLSYQLFKNGSDSEARSEFVKGILQISDGILFDAGIEDHAREQLREELEALFRKA